MQFLHMFQIFFGSTEFPSVAYIKYFATVNDGIGANAGITAR